MRKIDLLLQKARVFVVDALAALYSGNDDEFLEALGVDPALFTVTLPDGSVGYDFMKALYSTAAEDWADWEDEEEPEEEEQPKEELPEEIEVVEVVEPPKKDKKPKTRHLFGWG